MTDDVGELYQEMILDHSRHPRNFRTLEPPSVHVDGNNPLCGDRIRVFLRMNGDRIEDVAFQGAGCAISTASASLMTESLKGSTRSEASELIERFRNVVTGPPGAPAGEAVSAKLRAFVVVRHYPTRVKCAVLAWHALGAALSGESGETVSTE